MTRRAALLVPAAVALAVAVLAGSVSLGLCFRAILPAPPLRDAAPIDYEAAPFGSFTPLSASYITDVLGSVVAVQSPGAAIALAGTARTAPALLQPSATRLEVVHELSNDDRAQARVVPSVPFTARTGTRDATREQGETAACGPAGGTVWYRYTPSDDVGLVANTFGTNHATTLGVFDDSRTVGCDTDLQGNAIVQFNAVKGATYWFQVAAPAGGGSLVFSLDPDGVTTLESVSNSGDAADATAYCPSLDAGGDLVAFDSDATNLVPGDTNASARPGEERRGSDVFVRDRRHRTITAVSVSPSGELGDGNSYDAYLSGNGRYVAFTSTATNLVPDDTNGIADVFVRDLATGRTDRVSVSSAGDQAVGDAREIQVSPQTAVRHHPSLSYDGRYVAFQSSAPNLVAGDTNHNRDVFVHDRMTRTTERVSVHSSGRESPPGATSPTWMMPSISGNGRFVSFASPAPGLVDGDDNASNDLFVHDRLTHTTERIAGPTEGQAHLDDDDAPRYLAPELCTRQALSADGRFVTFSAAARPIGHPGEAHIFVHDRETRTTVQVDVSSAGHGAEDGALARSPAVSADGRFVAFQSDAANLVPGDDNEAPDVFVHDLATATTARLSASPVRRGCGDCGGMTPSISADGRVVAFMSVVNTFLVSDAATDQVYVNERPAPAG